MEIAEAINILADFCGKRDIQKLTQKNLYDKYGFEQADIFVLFGGSILEGGNVLARAIQNKVAHKYIIVGGVGHTTENLRQRMHNEYNNIRTEGLSEAEIFASFLKYKYTMTADYLETRSTNCGNNISYLMELLQEKNINFQSIIIAQDATMQCRMEKVLRKFVPSDVIIINYATYKVTVYENNGHLIYSDKVWGMWEMERYITLLMGEIPRLTDDVNGYGPLGSNYLVHVDIPESVKEAFDLLRSKYKDSIRAANPLFASK
jgi:uncharacterized SAM-binding protein YcdF (DUF218 family)